MGHKYYKPKSDTVHRWSTSSNNAMMRLTDVRTGDRMINYGVIAEVWSMEPWKECRSELLTPAEFEHELVKVSPPTSVSLLGYVLSLTMTICTTLALMVRRCWACGRYGGRCCSSYCKEELALLLFSSVASTPSVSSPCISPFLTSFLRGIV